MKYHPTQFLLRLTQTITVERGDSLVCIPDRTTADHELFKLKHKLGLRPIKSAIRKDKPGPGSTYTLRYFTSEALWTPSRCPDEALPSTRQDLQPWTRPCHLLGVVCK
jgi:hypothetical protein